MDENKLTQDDKRGLGIWIFFTILLVTTILYTSHMEKETKETTKELAIVSFKAGYVKGAKSVINYVKDTTSQLFDFDKQYTKDSIEFKQLIESKE